MATVVLISLAEAAAIIQPHIGDLSAFNWLADLRRRRKSYRGRTKHEPIWLKIGGKIFHPKSEIDRLISSIKPAPSTA